MIRKVLLCVALLVIAASNGFAYSSADLVFSVIHSDLGANASVISTWGSFTETGATGFDPTVQTLTDPNTSQSIKWAKPAAGTLNSSGTTTAGGSGFTTGVIDGIANTGFTIVTAIIPSTNTLGSTDYRSIVNAYLGGLGLYQMDNGKVAIRLQKTYNTYNTFITGSAVLTDGTRTVLSVVVSNTGAYEVWKDTISGGATVSTQILSGTSSSWPTGNLLPSVTPTGSTATSRNSIGLGSVGGPITGVNSSTFRGYIGDTYLYKTALTSAERIALVNTVETSMGMLSGGTSYTITASAGTGGTINPSGAVSVPSGTNKTFTITPNTGYSISQVTVDGANQGAITTYTFSNVTANHTISATFVANPVNYTITASAGANGTISPTGAVSVPSGTNKTFTITANSGYSISQVTVDGVNQGAIGTYTFTNVTANHTISATFVANPTTYTITASAGAGGSISPSGAVVVNSGANQTFAIAPNTGYSILDVIVDGVGQGPIISYTFPNVTANHTISVTFVASSLTKLIDINVSSITGADGTAVSSWTNAGTLAGAFGLDGTDQTTRPVIATTQGKRCVQFDGSNDRLKLLNGSTPINAPAGLTGNSDWTVAGWYLNPVIASTEQYLCWASNAEAAQARCSFGYGSHNGDGAVMHGVGTINYNMPFIPVPAAGMWHHLAVTFDGSVEKTYVDGVLNQTESKTLAIAASQPFMLGCLYATPTGGTTGTRYSGSIASLTVYDQALTATDISSLATYTVSGHVTDPTGASLAGAVVGFKSSSKVIAGLAISATADADVYALTDASGNYSARLLKDCTYYGAAWKDGYTASSDVSVTVDTNKTVNLSVTAVAGYNLAAGKTVTAGTLYASATGLGANPVDNACDNNLSTYMSWATSSQKDLVIDVTKPSGTADSINGLTIITNSYHFNDWEIWVESNADPIVSGTVNTSATWTRVYGSVGSYGGYDRIPVNGQVVDPVKFATTSARGVWIKIFNGPSNDVRPFEVMVHSSATPVSIATAEGQADGTTVFLNGDSVIWAPRDANAARTTSYFYVEDSSKTAGIRIDDPSGVMDNVKVNDAISVIGTMATIANTGERYVSATLVPVGSTGSGITPTTMNTQTVWTTSSAVGKLAAVTGTVRQVAADGTWFTIADGYMVNSVEVQTKVYVQGAQLPADLATVGQSIKVIGAVGKEYASGINSVIYMFNFENITGAADEFTFITISDVHYGATGGNETGVPARIVIDEMNAIAGRAWPGSLGGSVQTPRGVIVIGDIADGGTTAQFDMFAADYGINADGRLRYPVFEGLGNHDGRIDGPVALKIKARTPYRRNLTGISSNGMHYSWDWNSVHFIELNRAPVNVGESNSANALVGDPCYARDFVQQDLAANVGTSGRPVFIVHHYGFEEFSAGWWTQNERALYHDILDGYNVIGIAHGHKHTPSKYQWDGLTYGTTLPNSIDVYQDGAGYNGDIDQIIGYYVYRVTNNSLSYAERHYDSATGTFNWSSVYGTKPITTP